MHSEDPHPIFTFVSFYQDVIQILHNLPIETVQVTAFWCIHSIVQPSPLIPECPITLKRSPVSCHPQASQPPAPTGPRSVWMRLFWTFHRKRAVWPSASGFPRSLFQGSPRCSPCYSDEKRELRREAGFQGPPTHLLCSARFPRFWKCWCKSSWVTLKITPNS